MNISELLEAAKSTSITEQQISELRGKLEKQADEYANQQQQNSSTAFLNRTYTL